MAHHGCCMAAHLKRHCLSSTNCNGTTARWTACSLCGLLTNIDRSGGPTVVHQAPPSKCRQMRGVPTMMHACKGGIMAMQRCHSGPTEGNFQRPHNRRCTREGAGIRAHLHLAADRASAQGMARIYSRTPHRTAWYTASCACIISHPATARRLRCTHCKDNH